MTASEIIIALLPFCAGFVIGVFFGVSLTAAMADAANEEGENNDKRK